MTRRVLVVLALIGSAVPVHAQTPASSPAVEFVPRAAFYMTAERLGGVEDLRFRWDAHFGGELDLVDFRLGRASFAADYEVVMGDQRRRFDPNQGNYILEGALSARLPHVEVAGVFYHQSRHLSDRPLDVHVAWNMLGVRAQQAFILGAVHLSARADVRGVVQRTFVDYRWEFDGRLRGDRVVRPGVGLMAAAGVRHLGAQPGGARPGVTGFRAEGGVRLEGGGGAVELFAGVERRIDPYPLEFGTATWATAGFRLLSR